VRLLGVASGIGSFKRVCKMERNKYTHKNAPRGWRDWTPISGIYLPHHGGLKALLLYLEKPPTHNGKNVQQLHLIKLNVVPQEIRNIMNLQLEPEE
jgi:hypothetical protein